MRNLIVALYEYLRVVARVWWRKRTIGDRCIWCRRPATFWLPHVKSPLWPRGAALCAFCVSLCRDED